MVGVVVLDLWFGLKFFLRRITFYTNSDRCGLAVAFFGGGPVAGVLRKVYVESLAFLPGVKPVCRMGPLENVL